MDDQFEHEYATPDQDGSELDSPEPEWAAEQTGNDTVDGVLAKLSGLDDLPVDAHVAVFEQAHEQLRSALDNPRED